MARKVQQTIPEMDVPEVVKQAAEDYLKPKRGIAKLREKMNAALERLIEMMNEHEITEMLIDDGDQRLILCSKDLVKITKRKKADGSDDSDGEGGED